MPERVPIFDRLVWLTSWGALLMGSLGGIAVLVLRTVQTWPLSGAMAILVTLACLVLGLGVRLFARKLMQGPPRAFLLRSGAAIIDGLLYAVLELVLFGSLGMLVRALWRLLSRE